MSDSEASSESTATEEEVEAVAKVVSMIEPTDKDVIIGLGRAPHLSKGHPGNATFDCMVEGRKVEYQSCGDSINAKKDITRSVTGAIRKSGGRFLKVHQKEKVWVVLSDENAHKATTKALKSKTVHAEDGAPKKAIVYVGKTNDDVLCGQGKLCYLHPGSIAFRKFLDTKNYEDFHNKTAFCQAVVAEIQNGDPPRRFLQQNKAMKGPNNWFVVGNDIAATKVQSYLRHNRKCEKDLRDADAKIVASEKKIATADALDAEVEAMAAKMEAMRAEAAATRAEGKAENVAAYEEKAKAEEAMRRFKLGG